MNFGTLKTTVAGFLNRDDMTSMIPTFIQVAQKRLEREWDYRCMESSQDIIINNTGSENNSYLSLPTSYKNTKWMKILVNSIYQPMQRMPDSDLIDKFPNIAERGRPEAYATSAGETIIKPLPDITYTIYAVHRIYTTDLSSDSDTNFWTTDGWDCLLFGALVEAGIYLSDDRLSSWDAVYQNKRQSLRDSETLEKREGSNNQVRSAYAV